MCQYPEASPLDAIQYAWAKRVPVFIDWIKERR